MTIEQLGGARLAITLSKNDMKAFSLEYSNICFEDKIFQTVLKRLLKLARERVSISMRNKALFVEALERYEGCILLITVLPRSGVRPKRYRVKHGRAVMFSFENSDDLTDCMVQLYKNDLRFLKGEVFRAEDGYKLIIEHDLGLFSRRALGVLSEYCSQVTKNDMQIAQAREYGDSLTSGFPVLKIGSVFAGKQV